MIGEQRLKSLGDTGKVPATRLSEPEHAKQIVEETIRADEKRARVRKEVKGLVDGNPPYKDSERKKHGLGHTSNTNWRIAEAFLNQGIGAIYDIFSETPTYAEVRLEEDDPNKREDWSGIQTEEYERLQRKDRDFDFHVQRSQHDMMLYGLGPLVWEDKYSICVKSVAAGDLYLFDNEQSNVSEWDLCAVMMEYKPWQLYNFIQDGESARKVGWNVTAARKAIMKAHPSWRNGMNGGRNWEWHQQQLRCNNIGYSYQADTIRVAMICYKEFPREGSYSGKISECIIPSENWNEDRIEFLFQAVDYCDRWQNKIAPMYYDHGDGLHHSVKGMGIKFYSSLAYQNRLICSIADKAMQPKIALKPLNDQAANKTSMMQMGDYLVMPVGYDVAQVGFSGMIEDALVAKRDFESLLASNLSQYRQNLQKSDGNPITATEAQFRAGEQARLGKTQLARYYEQLDAVYEERYRRAVDPNQPKYSKMYDECKEFRDRCVKRGVSLKAMAKYESVKAARIVGQGSSMLRQQTLERMLGIIAMLPEGGRINLLSDFISANAGQVLRERYYPIHQVQRLPSDHVAQATDQVAGMKVGLAPVITDSQDHVAYIGVFLKAAFQAITSLEQGGNPMEVATFLELAGTAIAGHLDQIRNDQSRKAFVEQTEEQLKELASIHDKLVAQIQQQQKQQAKQAQQAQQRQQQMMSDEALASQELMLDTRRKDVKAQTDIQRKNVVTAQKMRLADATTAHKIELDKAKAESQSTNGE